MSDFVQLTTVAYPALAQPLVDFLAEQGVSAHVPTDNLGNVDPSLSFSYGTRVLVPAAELERAEALLADFFAASDEPTPELSLAGDDEADGLEPTSTEAAEPGETPDAAP